MSMLEYMQMADARSVRVRLVTADEEVEEEDNQPLSRRVRTGAGSSAAGAGGSVA